MATWAESRVSGMMLDREQRFLSGGGAEDANKLDQETQGAILIAAGVDQTMIAMHKRDGSDLGSTSLWPGGMAKQQHDIHPGEIVVADRKHARLDYRNPTRRPGVFASVNGHTSLPGSGLDTATVQRNPELEEVAQRQVMRESHLMGVATTLVDTTPGQGFGTMSQGVTVQQGGLMNLYSPLYAMGLGELVEVVPAPPSGTGSARNPEWLAREGTPDTKAVFIPRPLKATSASRLARDGIGRYVNNPEDTTPDKRKARFALLDNEVVRQADADARVTHAALNAALTNYLVIRSVLETEFSEVGRLVVAELGSSFGLYGTSTDAAQTAAVRQAVAEALFVRNDDGVVRLDATQVIGAGAALKNPATNAGKLAQAQLNWSRLFGAVFEQHQELASRTLGRVVQGGQREFKAVR